MSSRHSMIVGTVVTLAVVALLYALFVAPLIAVRADLHRMAADLTVTSQTAATGLDPVTPREATELKTSLYATDISAVSAILSFVSLLAVLLSILLVVSQTQTLAAQTRHITESLRHTATAALTQRNFSVHEIFIENPHMRPYFYDDQPIGSSGHDHYLQAHAVAGYLLDSFYFLIHETRKGQSAVGADISTDWFEPYIRQSFERSDVLCSYFDAHEDWFAVDESGRTLKRLRGGHHRPPKTRVHVDRAKAGSA